MGHEGIGERGRSGVSDGHGDRARRGDRPSNGERMASQAQTAILTRSCRSPEAHRQGHGGLMVRSVFMLMRALQPTPVAQARSRRSRMVMDGRLNAFSNSLVRYSGWPVVGIGSAEEFSAGVSESWASISLRHFWQVGAAGWRYRPSPSHLQAGDCPHSAGPLSACCVGTACQMCPRGIECGALYRMRYVGSVICRSPAEPGTARRPAPRSA